MLFPRPCGIKAFPIGSMGLAFLFPHFPQVCHGKETKCRKLCIDGCTIHGSYEFELSRFGENPPILCRRATKSKLQYVKLDCIII